MSLPDLPDGWRWFINKPWSMEKVVVAITLPGGGTVCSRLIKTERDGTKYGTHWLKSEVEKVACEMWREVERDVEFGKFIAHTWPQSKGHNAS